MMRWPNDPSCNTCTHQLVRNDGGPTDDGRQIPFYFLDCSSCMGPLRIALKPNSILERQGNEKKGRGHTFLRRFYATVFDRGSSAVDDDGVQPGFARCRQ